MVGKLVELIEYRELVRNLVVRNLKVRYKNSALGFVWSLLNPLFLMVILTVVFSLVFGDVRVQNFPAFLIVGLIPWNFSSSSLSDAVSSVVDNGHLIKKVYFPREALPLSVVLAHFVHFLLAVPVLLLLLVVLGVHFTSLILMLPFLMVVQLMLIVGIALAISCINVFYRDMHVALNVLLQGWFFMTPIFYHHHILPLPLQKPAMANPLAAIITAYRDILIYGRLPDSHFTWGAVVSSFAVFLVGYYLFKRYSPVFAEEV
ncbi:MAG: ABC transporter permease [Anaerolineae bacterium]